LRPLGLTGLLQSLAHNINRKEKNLAFFEVSKRFLDDREENVLSMIATGEFQHSWDFKQQSTYYFLKGMAENCFRCVQKNVPGWKASDFMSGTFLDLVTANPGGEILAFCGQIQESVAVQWDIEQEAFYAEINLDRMLKLPDHRKAYAGLPKFPPARRDISFFIDRKVSVDEIVSLMRQEGGPLLHHVQLFDQYFGKLVPKGKRSLAFSLEYQKPDGTFTDEEIRGLHTKIGTALTSHLGADLR